MMRPVLLFLCCLTSALLKAQATISFPLTADAFYGVDDFQAVYYNIDNTLWKNTGTTRQQFYDVQLGAITSVDLINPLKVLVFYKDTQTVVLLDNRMNELERIVLSDLQPFRFIDHVALAGERRLWLHNLDNNTIELYNYVEERTASRTPLLKSEVLSLHTDYNFCHVRTAAGLLLSFNTYGSQTYRLEVPEGLITYDFEKLAVVGPGTYSMYRFNRDFEFIAFRESGNKTTSPSTSPPETAMGTREPGSTTGTFNDTAGVRAVYLKGINLYIWDGKTVQDIVIKQPKKQ